MNRLFRVLHLLSLVIMIFSFTMLAPLAVALWYQDGTYPIYCQAAITALVAGALAWLATRRHKRELTPRDGFLLVVLAYVLLPLCATLPLLLQISGLSFTDAYFEAVSGITASGGTVLHDIDKLPRSINFWRCQMIWLGGMGLIVLAVAILPLLGVGGMQLYKAETPGPMKDTKLTPRITETAKGLWLVYVGLTVVCALSYRAAGMPWFDAVCHSFTTLGLGGFSTHDASFAYFDSPAIEAVGMVFMLLAALNFATHFVAWRQKSMRPYRTDPEARMVVLVALGSCVGIATYLYLNGVYPDFASALRYASFNVVSVATTTGYSNTDYNLWPVFAPLWMLLLCCIVSSSGSTGSGIKMVRAELLLLQGLREMVKLIHPSAQVPIKLAGQMVPNQIVYAVLAFMSLYGASIVVMTFLLLATGLDFMTAFSAVVASINNTGPGLASVGPAETFSHLTDLQTWVCIFAMLLGRLELFTLLVVFTPAFWRK